MGTPDFGIPILTALHNSHKVVGVFTRPDSPVGRGRRRASSPVKDTATALGIRVYEPHTMRDEESMSVLTALRPDVVVVAAFSYLLPSSILEIPPYGCLNVHPSLLPRHRGAAPVAGAILSGDSRTGVSIMIMDEGLDTGPLLSQRSIPLEDFYTTGSLSTVLADMGAHLLLGTLDDWLAGRIEPEPQDESAATYTGRISVQDGWIDWSRPARELWRRVRAFSPWPGSYTSWRGKRLKIHSAVPLELRASGEPGTVVATPPGIAVPVGVVTGDGVLGLEILQLEGKREMSAREFLIGQRSFVGAVLPG
ncbi:MAG: methionyl-tRNA formyltransferase [Chloroflexota bacterium]